MKKALKILIVEDNPVNAQFVQELLSRASNVSFDFTKVATLAAASEVLQKPDFDIILLDLDLPDSQGYETFKAINNLAPLNPIIILSSIQDEEIAMRAVREGAQDYFIKGTFEGKLLIRALLYAVERKQKESEMKEEYTTQNKVATQQLAIQLNVATALAEATNLNNAAHSILKTICEVLEWQVGEIWALDQSANVLKYVANWHASTIPIKLEQISQEITFAIGEGIPGHIWKIRTPYWVNDLSKKKLCSRTEYITQLGLKCCFGFPIIFQNDVLGIMLFFSDQLQYPDPDFLALFTSIGNQIATFIKHKRIEGDLLYLAQHDILTGLANRAVHEDSLNHAIINAKRHQYLVALLYLDLDNFKKVNDTLGYIKGDLLLQEVARRLRRTTRETDSIARFGGDEFAIVLPRGKSKEDIIVIAQKILYVISRPFIIEGQEFYLTVSIGISIYPDDGQDAQTLLRNADMAMYHAKERGKNNYQFCQRNMEIINQQKIKLENELHSALKKQEFVLHYQPIVDIKTNKIVSLEALIRWRRYDGRILFPNEFIPLLEQSNLILSIGEWIIQTACQQIKNWKQLEVMSIAINISVHQLNMHFITAVGKILKTTQLAPIQLVLELTEGTLMQETESNIYILNALKDLGIHLSIDDFGTGYSSLAYLKNFTVDSVKIDKSFVASVPENITSAAIVSAVIAMAHSLNIKTIAEGVETKEQLDFLKKMNCDEYQGFYFSRPLPPDELFALIKGRSE
ncbi:MAG: EAL domain-containing protein [Gammaproteobacteria bacterium]